MPEVPFGGGDVDGKDITPSSVTTEAQDVGETMTPPPDANLVDVIANNGGKTIDLAGRTYRLPQTATIPASETTIQNGVLTDHPDSSTSDYDNLLLMQTPDGSDYTDLEFRNLTYRSENGNAQRGLRTRDCLRTQIINCRFTDLFRAGITLEGKH